MKLLHITSAYPTYLQRLYQKHPEIASKSYADQLKAIHADAFATADSWTHALSARGYECAEILYNAEPLQRGWWKENRNSSGTRFGEEIAVEQIRAFAPDILWFDDHNEALLVAIKQAVPKIRLVLGWMGSAIPEKNAVDHIDCVISCAQESVDYFRSHGKDAEQLHHAFDERIIQHLSAQNNPASGIVFVGQILSGTKYHDERAELLRQISQKAPLSIYSSLAEESWIQRRKSDAKTALRFLANPINNPAPFVNSYKNMQFKNNLKPAVYGLEMYEALKSYTAVLNIHADSSPQYASNMRLFETTGVGACLITDWKENLASLFVPDEEVLAYKTSDECLEKIRWAIDNPQAAARIGTAAQKRTLQDHTVAKRMEILDLYIKKRL